MAGVGAPWTTFEVPQVYAKSRTLVTAGAGAGARVMDATVALRSSGFVAAVGFGALVEVIILGAVGGGAVLV